MYSKEGRSDPVHDGTGCKPQLFIEKLVRINVIRENVRHPFPVYASLEKVFYVRADAEDRHIQVFFQTHRL